MSIETVHISPWFAIPAALFLIIGGIITLTGALGLLWFKGFFVRMHAASMANTLGTGCLLLASMLISTALGHRPVIHEILVFLFIVLTPPITAMILMRAMINRLIKEKHKKQLSLSEGQDKIQNEEQTPSP